MNSVHLSKCYNDDSISGLFRDLTTAEKAFQSAIACGYTQSEINILILDYAKKEYLSELKNNFYTENIDEICRNEFNGIYTALTVLDNHLIINDIGLIIIGPLAYSLKRPRMLSKNMRKILLNCHINESDVRKYELGLLMGGIVMVIDSPYKYNVKLSYEWKKLNAHELKLVLEDNQSRPCLLKI